MHVPVLRTIEVDDPRDAFERAEIALESGLLVVLPTETVYGAAGRLDRPDAVARLRTMRGNAAGPFTIHVPHAEAIEPFVGPPSELARRMMRKFWPGPVAFVFNVAPDVRAAAARKLKLDERDLYADGAITLRCPDDRFTTRLLGRIDGPVAMTRVETRAGPSPFDAGTLDALPAGDVALIIDSGRTRFSKPSTIVKLDGDAYRVVREGVYDERIIARQLKTTILFVCSGNTCRSPMAAAIATKQLKDALAPGESSLDSAGVEVISAGTFAMPGLRATPQGVDAVAELGADLSTHRSRQLSPELIHSADFIITMGKSHTQAVLAMAPMAADRVLALDPGGDVEDPIGGDISLYRSVASRFEKLVADRLAETVFVLHPTGERRADGSMAEEKP